ncbi:MAG: hypothetical protein WAK72_07075 [Pseudolabrys sp.]
MPVADQDHGCVPMAPAARLAGRVHQPLDLTRRQSGKAFGRPRVPAETEQRIREALATPGRPGFHEIAAQFGVATGTVQRIAQA